MGGYAVYQSDAGTPTARPVIAWGRAPEGQEGLQADEAGEISIATDQAFDEAFTYTYDPVAETFAATPAAPPAETEETVTRRMRELLRASDWTQLPDSDLSPQQVTDWAIYRRNLKIVPQQPGFPTAVTWPTPPPEEEF